MLAACRRTSVQGTLRSIGWISLRVSGHFFAAASAGAAGLLGRKESVLIATTTHASKRIIAPAFPV